MKKILFFLFISTLFISCARVSFEAGDFYTRTKNHKKIAVIPFQMEYTGRMPAKVTEAQLKEIQEAEAKAFQQSLFNQIVNRGGGGKKDVYINVQRVDETNRRLTDSGIALIDAYKVRPETLAQILEVDAVVKTRVVKNRYLSDLESFGISIAQDILDILLPNANVPTPVNPEKTFDIESDSELIDGLTGDLLWKSAIKTQTDWNYPANYVIDDLNRMFSKRFPYRNDKRYGKK